MSFSQIFFRYKRLQSNFRCVPLAADDNDESVSRLCSVEVDLNER